MRQRIFLPNFAQRNSKTTTFPQKRGLAEKTVAVQYINISKEYKNDKMTLRTRMKKLICLVGLVLIGANAHAQKKEGHLSAVSRNLEIFNDLYKQLELFYVDSLNADTVMQWCIDGMLRKVDPYTGYYPQDDEELRTMSTGKYAGIGSVVRFHKKEDRVVISEPYWDSPSQKAGVKAGDVILSIDKKDVKGMPVDKVSNMLRGEAGTTFELKVKRTGEKKPLSFKITRETIRVPQVPYYGLLQPGVGYICLTGFADGAGKEMRQALLELKKQGADRLILDLRDNPGGSLDESVDIANLFIPKGKKVVYTKGKMASTNRDFYTAVEPVDTVMPLVVMVDGGTASSAEIVSGSLQDMDRAVIIGTRTFGKGLVQMIRDLPYGGNLKITTSRYYIPSGRCIQAYDYRHLNPDGSVGTIPDSLTKVFHTASGREVRDGGGIKPDMEIKPDSLPTLIYDLVSSDAFFDFATQYVLEHETIAQPGEFALSDEDYAKFTDFVCASGFKYNRRSDNVLDLFHDVAKREGYLEAIENDLKALRSKLSTDLRADLLRFREKIEPYVCDELMRRYYYQKGSIRQMLVKDPCTERALELLSDPKTMWQKVQEK